MITIGDTFQQINDVLPKDVVCKSFSVIPLPYNGYYEIYVEADNEKRYRCLATKDKTLSNFTEWSMPGLGAKGVKNA